MAGNRESALRGNKTRRGKEIFGETDGGEDERSQVNLLLLVVDQVVAQVSWKSFSSVRLLCSAMCI